MVSMDIATPPLTPAQRAALRTGPCIAIACKERCEAFDFVGTHDGFKTCICGHTQHAHAYGVGENGEA